MTTRTRSALIVAHGQPSDPGGPEGEIAAFAERVAALLPGWAVRSATLAGQGTLETALGTLRAGTAEPRDGASADDGPLVFPLFMADGWFIRTNLPRRLGAAGLAAPRILTPFGLLAETQALAVRILAAALDEAGLASRQATVVLAAHGSGASPMPAQAAKDTAASIAASLPVARVLTGFIEEPPLLADVLTQAGDETLCLPLFVARWGHVAVDLPDAVRASGFRGRMLDPIGLHADVPAIVARALEAGT